jgi:hypothetical protein
MPTNVRKVFKAHCGDGAKYLGSEFLDRGDHSTVMIQFEIIPEGRKFGLDGVIHGDGGDDEIERAVLKIADIAKNVRQHISAES